MASLGIQNLTASFYHLHLALAAGGFTAAGRGKENALLSKGMHYIASLLYIQYALAIVDVYLNRAARGDFVFHHKQYDYQDKGDQNRYDYRTENY
jgi:hypothetical protein